MPQFKSPESLKELAKRCIRRPIEEKIEYWARLLIDAEYSSFKDWYKCIVLISEDSRILSKKLRAENPTITSEILPDVIKRFSTIVQDFCDKEIEYPVLPERHKVTNQLLMQVFLETLLVPSITEYNLTSIPSNIITQLIIRRLHIFTNITVLILPGRSIDFKANEIEDTIGHLKMLKKLEYKYDCTVKVVRMIGEYCKHITELNFRFSRRVNDLCTTDLLRIKKLRKLDIQYTCVSYAGYAEIINGLKLENIAWVHNIDRVLFRVREVNLDSVRSVTCCTTNPYSLVLKFPQITELTIHGVDFDLSDLSELNSLTTFSLQSCNYRNVNFINVIRHLDQLTELRFSDVIDICCTEVIVYGKVLKILEIHICTLQQIFVDLSSDLPHFTSLEILILMDTPHTKYYLYLLKFYQSLQCIHARCIPDFEDIVFDIAVTIGKLKNLRELVVENCSFRSSAIVSAAIKQCRYLSTFGNLQMMECFDGKNEDTFIKWIEMKRYDLKLINQPMYYVRTNMIHYL